jgi:iron complex outermembrane receptor protein
MTRILSKDVTSRGLGCIRIGILVAMMLLTGVAQAQDDEFAPGELKKLSLEDLMDIEVTTVSKRSEKLSEVASAIQVITREDILRSGATSIPEALRLAQNLQMAQFNSSAWLVSARGFNNIFANKLLVMIDGRTVYSPLFAGVYWDVQSVLMEDIDRIEVISGPGGTLWGANAVNGIINIITRKASDTDGLYASGAVGTLLKDFAAVRYGQKINDRLSYRVFAQRFDRGRTSISDGSESRDKWYLNQAGMRADWTDTEKNDVSFQANFYNGEQQTNERTPNPTPSSYDGQNALLKWTHTISTSSNFTAQVYYDRTWRRDPPSTFNDQLNTYDFDFQHHIIAGKRNNILWGAGYRWINDESQHSTIIVGFLPETRRMDMYSGFIQDEISIVPDRLKVTLGSKLLHNVYTGFEVQPSARLSFIASSKNTLWAAVSRAVRTPSRIDVDYYLPTFEVPPQSPSVAGGPNFVSEKVVAYELGYRVQPSPSVSLSLATFYNQYRDLYSVEPIPGTSTLHIQNGTEGESYGVEFSFISSPMDWWKLRGGYTYFHKDVRSKPGHSFDTSYAGTDPANQFLVQSMMDLPGRLKLDLIGRYVDDLPPSPIAGLIALPSYFDVTARVAWVYHDIEIAVVGQNILNQYHSEYGTNAIPQGHNLIPRNIFAQITFRHQ